MNRVPTPATYYDEATMSYKRGIFMLPGTPDPEPGPDLFACPWCDVCPLPEWHHCEALGGAGVTRGEVERQHRYDLTNDHGWSRLRPRLIPFLAAAAIFALGALVYWAPWAH